MEEKSTLFILFGASGDLAKRKLYPSLFRLYRKKELNHHFAVIGTARRSWSHEEFQHIVNESIATLNPTLEEANEFISHFYYQAHNVTDKEHYVALKKLADTLDKKYELNGNRIFYLAMAPQFFGVISEHIKSEDIITTNGFNRLIIEKPFGSDYQTALELNNQINAAFSENQIYRIDHYLGKEMIQNIFAVRFSNNIFESLWDNHYIDNIQITLAESIGVEERGGYYDQSGALKDMVQNHVLQIVSLLAMEPPAYYSEETIREEKIKALRAIRIYDKDEANKAFIRGQYGSGEIDGEVFCSYRDENNVNPTSNTETFVAGKLLIDNFRWTGVPFYIRTGKRMTEKGTRINIVFKPVPLNILRGKQVATHDSSPISPNILTIYIQPTEGFSLSLNGKRMGENFELDPVRLDYRHSSEITSNTPEAYERLILDVINGDGTNFTHWEEVAQSWRIVDAIEEAWANEIPNFPNYTSRTMGPTTSFKLLENEGAEWIWTPEEWFKDRNQLTW